MRKLTLLAMMAAASAALAQTINLSSNGNTDYVIVVPDNDVAVIQTAATELAEHLKAITGADYAIVKESAKPAGKPMLSIGPTMAAKAVFADPFFTTAKYDTTAITFKGNDVYLAGRYPAGPLYAVYVLLEDYCGVRWWTPDESFIPAKPTLSISARNYLYAPAIRSRETFYKLAQECKFAARNRNNGHFVRVTPEFGGRQQIIGWCHTFYQFLPPDKYAKDHPEWYSLVNGKRAWNRNQLCLTNEDMTKEFIRVCREQIKKNPGAGLISVSQNDWHGRCECPNCKAIEEEEGSPSGLLIRFVNKVATALKAEYPDLLFETLAYQYTRKAPKITHPADNVVIRLCSIEMNFAQSLENGPDNASFKKDIEDWSNMAKNLYIWNYVTNFRNYLLPQPNYRNLASDIRFFVRHHAIGLFEQGDTGSTLGDFVRPRAWVLTKLLWNPAQDEMALVREFFNGYYGAAGPYLLDYINFLCDKVEAANYNLRCYNQDVNGWLNAADIEEARKLYAKAEAAVSGNAILAERVRRERVPLDLIRLMSAENMIRHARFAQKGSKVEAQEILQLAQEFKDLTVKWNIGNLREGRPIGKYADTLIDNIKTAMTFEFPKATLDLAKLPDGSWDYVMPSNFNLHGEGKLVTIVDDPASLCGGKVARMTNTHKEWATQLPLPNFYVEAHKRWKIRAEFRCDAASQEGSALTFGVWSNAGHGIYSQTVPVKDIAGKTYKVIETPYMNFESSQYFWVCPVIRDPKDVEAVYTGAVTLIAEPDNK